MQQAEQVAEMKKGSAWEARIVAYLRDHGAPHAERRVMGGASDRGDVAGIPGVVICTLDLGEVSDAKAEDAVQSLRG